MRLFLLSCLVVAVFDYAKKMQPENNEKSSNDELVEFATANYLFWYFSKNGYNVDDIGSISGGIVESLFCRKIPKNYLPG